jgi:hypothetical protein
LYDSRFKDFKGKFFTCWLGPYKVDTVYDNGSINMCTIDEDWITLMANVHRLRLYQKPLSKDFFIKDLTTYSNLKVDGTMAMPLVPTTN